MPRLLTERDSTTIHLNASRRHVRLLRRSRCEELIQGIDPLIADLTRKQQESAERGFDTQAAYDEVLASDADLDDAVRNLADAGKQYDRANPTTPALPTLFPNGGYGQLIELPVQDEPDDVDAVAKKVESLGPDHPLAPHAAKLRQASQAVRDALKIHGDSIRAEKSAEAEEDIAKSALRRKYEANYLDSRKLWGRVLADRLFPNLYSTKRSGGGGAKVVKGDFADKSA